MADAQVSEIPKKVKMLQFEALPAIGVNNNGLDR